jgi:hypothetical protein
MGAIGWVLNNNTGRNAIADHAAIAVHQKNGGDF